MNRSYVRQLTLAFVARGVVALSLLAIACQLGGCGHTLNTSSTGTLTREASPSVKPDTN